MSVFCHSQRASLSHFIIHSQILNATHTASTSLSFYLSFFSRLISVLNIPTPIIFLSSTLTLFPCETIKHLKKKKFFSQTKHHLPNQVMEGLPKGYRPNVGVCLINSDDQIFVASKLNVPGAWQMPQGGIEDGEEPKSAAIRELREETGIVSVEIITEVQKWLTYDFPPAVKAKVSRVWGGEWHGQAQKWFLMRLTKDDSEINLATGEADPEFAEWKWADPEEVIEQAVDYKRPTYEEVIRTFKPYFQGNAISAKCKSTKW